MSKQVTNEEVLAAGKKKRQAQRQKTAAETNKFNATKVAGHEAAAEQALAEADAINQEVEEGIVAENNVETPTYQSITYNGKTYSPEEVGKMFNAIETWGQHNLRPGDLKRFQKGMEGLHAQNQAGHIFISGVDPDYNRRGKFGGDANIIPEILLLRLLKEGSSGGTATSGTSSTSTQPSATSTTSGSPVGKIDDFRKYIMDTQFGGNYQQYKADLEAEERYTTREERLEHIRDAARAIMTERNLDTSDLDALTEEKDLLRQMQALGVNMNEVRQYLGIQKAVVDPYNIKIDPTKIHQGYTVVQDLMNDGYGIITGPNGPVLIDSNYQQVKKGPDELIHNKNGYVIFTDSQGNLKYGDLASFNQADFKALQNINSLGTTTFTGWQDYTIGNESKWNDYLEDIFEGKSGKVQYLDITGVFPELQGYGDYKIIATDNISEDAQGGKYFQNSNGYLYKPNGEKIPIKINTGTDSKITITGPDNKVLYSGFGETRTNYDTGWLDKGSYDFSYMDDYGLNRGIRGNEDYNLDMEEIDRETGKLKDKWYHNDALSILGNVGLMISGFFTGGATTAAAWGARGLSAGAKAIKAAKAAKALKKLSKTAKTAKHLNTGVGALGTAGLIVHTLTGGYGQQMDAETAEEMSALIDGMSSDLLNKNQYSDTDAKAYAYTVYRILTKENTQSLQRGVREMLMSEGWTTNDIKQLYDQFINFGIVKEKTLEKRNGGVLKAQSGLSFENVVTKDNEDIYKAQWAEQKAIDDYNNMTEVGDPHAQTKGGHGIGSNEWDVYDTVDSIVIGLDTLAAGASFIPGAGSIVSAISGIAATGVQFINDIAKGEEGSTVLKNLAWNGAFAVLGAIPGVKALKAGKAIKAGKQAINKSVKEIHKLAKAEDNMEGALKAYETAADSIKSALVNNKKEIATGLSKLANNEWVMGAAKWAGRAMQVAGAGTGAIGAYNVITDAASGEEIQLQDVRMMLGGLTGTAAGAMHSLGKRAAKNVGTTVGNAMDELGIVAKTDAIPKQEVKIGDVEIEIDVTANMTKKQAKEAANNKIKEIRNNLEQEIKKPVGNGEGQITEEALKQNKELIAKYDAALEDDTWLKFWKKKDIKGFDENAAKQSDDWKNQLIATKPKSEGDSAWQNFGRWYGKRYLGLNEKSVKALFKDDGAIDDVKAYQSSKAAQEAQKTDIAETEPQVKGVEPNVEVKPEVNPASSPEYNPKNASMEAAPKTAESPIKTPIEVRAQTGQQIESPIKGANEVPQELQKLTKEKNNKIVYTKQELDDQELKHVTSKKELLAKRKQLVQQNPNLYELKGGRLHLKRIDGKLTTEARRWFDDLIKRGLQPDYVKGANGVFIDPVTKETIYYSEGGSLNQIQLQKLGGLAQKANNRLGEPSSIQVDKFQPGGSARPAGSSANIQYTSENSNWYDLMGENFLNQLYQRLANAKTPQEKTNLLNQINGFQTAHHGLYTTQTDLNGDKRQLKTWVNKNEDVEKYQTDINNAFNFVNQEGIANATNLGAFTTTKNSYGIDAATKWGADGLYGAQTDMRRVLGRKGDMTDDQFDYHKNMFNSLGYEMYLDEPTGYYMLKEKSTTDPTVEKPEDNPKVNPEVEPKKDPNVTVTPTTENGESPKQYMGLDATAVEALPTLLRSLQTNKANLELMNSTTAPLHRYKNDHYKLTTDLTSENYLGALAAQAYHHADNVAHNTADLRQAQAVQMQGNQQASDYQLKGALANKQAYDESSKIAMATENEDSNYNRQVADTNDQIINADIMAKMQQLAGYNTANKNNWDTYETTVRMGKDLVKKQLASQAQQKAYMDYQNNYKTAYDKYTTDTNAVTDAISSLLQEQQDQYNLASEGGANMSQFNSVFDADQKVSFYRYNPTTRQYEENASYFDPKQNSNAAAYQLAKQKGWTWNQLKEYLNNQAYKTYESSVANYYRDYNNALNGTQYVHGQYYHIPYQEPWRGYLSDRTITQHKDGGTLSAKDRKEIVRLREGYKNLQKQVENMYESLKRDSKMVENILDGLSKERSFLLKQIFR